MRLVMVVVLIAVGVLAGFITGKRGTACCDED